MEIKVTKAILLENGQSLISFESNYGVAEGLWQNGLPDINSKHDVEIDLEGELTWSINAHEAMEQSSKLEKCGQYIRIIAQVNSIEDDGCCVLRLGDSILMTEIKDIPNL